MARRPEQAQVSRPLGNTQRQAGRAEGRVLFGADPVSGATAAGMAMAHARRMTRLRQRALTQPGNTQLAGYIRRAARTAGLLRAAIAALSLALIGLGALLGT